MLRDTQKVFEDLTDAGANPQLAKVMIRLHQQADEQAATKADLNELSQATKADLNELSQTTKADLNELRQAFQIDLERQHREIVTEINREMNQRFDQINERLDTMHEAMRVQTRWTVGAIVIIGAILAALLSIAEFA